MSRRMIYRPDSDGGSIYESDMDNHVEPTPLVDEITTWDRFMDELPTLSVADVRRVIDICSNELENRRLATHNPDFSLKCPYCEGYGHWLDPMQPNDYRRECYDCHKVWNKGDKP